MGVIVLCWDLLCSYHGESEGSFCVSLCSVYLSFCALCLGALQYWLNYTCKCKASAHRSTCCCFFFTRVKQLRTFPTICSNSSTIATFKVRSQQLLVVQMANTRTSGDTEQLFQANGPCFMHRMFPTHAQKAFQEM